MVITELDRVRKLSKLQKSLLAKGLRRHYKNNPYLASGFTVKATQHLRSVAASRALKRLAKRGLVERLIRGRWQLTELGVEVASRLHPQITLETEKPTAGELALAEFGARHRRRRRQGPRMSKAEADARFEALLRA